MGSIVSPLNCNPLFFYQGGCALQSFKIKVICSVISFSHAFTGLTVQGPIQIAAHVLYALYFVLVFNTL